MQEDPISASRVWRTRIVAVMLVGVLGLAALVARHHVRKGRGDRRGAVSLASVVFACAMIAWVIGSRHFADVAEEMDRFFTAIGSALFTAGLLWVLYLALEPYVRKLWPGTLVGWSRLLAGGFRDPRVGRDVLLGTLFGIAIVLLGSVERLLRPALGFSQLQPRVPNVSLLEGIDRVATVLLQLVFGAVFNSLWIVFAFVAINLIVRRVWITAMLVGGFLMVTSMPGILEAPPIWLGVLFSLFVVSAILFIVFRFGLLATITMFFVNFALSMAVLTLDTTKWFFPASATMLVVVAALIAYGFYASRGGEPLLGRPILD
jgi:serine/threonine-protein kinase